MTSSVPTWRFRKGDDVPEWLCDCIPTTPGGPRPSIIFGGDVIVVESDAAFWVLIAGEVPGDADIVMDAKGTKAEIFAYPISKPIYSAKQVSWWHRDPGDGDDYLGRGVGPVGGSPLVTVD